MRFMSIPPLTLLYPDENIDNPDMVLREIKMSLVILNLILLFKKNITFLKKNYFFLYCQKINDLESILFIFVFRH